MEYGSYYSPQSGQPPPLPSNQHLGLPIQQPGLSDPMMHSPMPHQNVRQQMPLGPQHHHQQIQQQQHLSHPPQHMLSQHHPNYHQVQPPHPHGPPSHSNSPHPQQQQHHNQQPSQQPPQQHHTLPQSPHHHGGPTLHHPQQQSHHQHHHQPMNHMVRPAVGPPPMNHSHPNFFNGGPVPQPGMHPHQPHSNQHHPHSHPSMHLHQQQPMMHHGPSIVSHLQPGMGRNSPYYPSLTQTEFRIVEMNRRFQCRTMARLSYPPNAPFDENLWWNRFTSEFFEDDATLTIRIQDDKPTEFTIGRTLIPRFFRTYFEGGVTDLSINLRNPKETCTGPQMITLECDQAFIITNHRIPVSDSNQAVVVHTEGHIILDFVSNSYESQLTIKSWKFFTKGCREYIDRKMTTIALSPAYMNEPVTKQGLTKSTITYLKMCMIMEPMQDLMYQHRITKIDPRNCLRKLLFEKYKFRSNDDNRGATSKRRKRKPSTAPAIPGSATPKKSRANVNNSLNNNNGLNNMMSPSTPGFSLATQDIMVVGEPTMMGGDFGDDNERMITRLENTQYDPSASNQSNADESGMVNASGDDLGITIMRSNMECGLEKPLDSTSASSNTDLNDHQDKQILQEAQQQITSDIEATNQDVVDTPVEEPSETQDVDQFQTHNEQSQNLSHQIHSNSQIESFATSESANSCIDRKELRTEEVGLIPENQQHQQQNPEPLSPSSSLKSKQQSSPLNESGQPDEAIVPTLEHSRSPKDVEVKKEVDTPTEIGEKLNPLLVGPDEVYEDAKVNSIGDSANGTNIIGGGDSMEPIESNPNSIQHINEESNSNSQLPCSTASAATPIEQQQPVDNGVA